MCVTDRTGRLFPFPASNKDRLLPLLSSPDDHQHYHNRPSSFHSAQGDGVPLNKCACTLWQKNETVSMESHSLRSFLHLPSIFFSIFASAVASVMSNSEGPMPHLRNWQNMHEIRIHVFVWFHSQLRQEFQSALKSSSFWMESLSTQIGECTLRETFFHCIWLLSNLMKGRVQIMQFIKWKSE